MCVLLSWWGLGSYIVLICRCQFVLCNSLDVINEVKNFLCQSIDMEDLGEVDVILNIKLTNEENGICHTQFLFQNQVLIICMTQDQLFHTYGQKCSQITKCRE
jgi:hypothetical protein